MRQSNRCEVVGGWRTAWSRRGVGIACGFIVPALIGVVPWPVGALDGGRDAISYDQRIPSFGAFMSAAATEFRPQSEPDLIRDEPVFRPWSAVGGSDPVFRPRSDDAQPAGAPQVGRGYAEPYRDTSPTAAFAGDGGPYREHDPNARAVRYYPPTPGVAAPRSAYGPPCDCGQRWPPPGGMHAPSAPLNHVWLWPLLAVDIPPPWLWSY